MSGAVRARYERRESCRARRCLAASRKSERSRTNLRPTCGALSKLSMPLSPSARCRLFLVLSSALGLAACEPNEQPAARPAALDGGLQQLDAAATSCAGNGLVCRTGCASDVSLQATCVGGEWTCAAPYVSDLRPQDCAGKWGGACRPDGSCDADLACAGGTCLAPCRSGAGAGSCRARAAASPTTCECVRVDAVCQIPGDSSYVCPDGTIPASTCTSTVPGC